MSRVQWFASVGAPLDDTDVAEIRAMLSMEPLLETAEIARADDWLALTRFQLAQDFDSSWWEFEEEEPQRLWALAAEQLSEEELSARLGALNEALAAEVGDGAKSAASRAGISDPELIRAATGAALLAAQQNALAVLAGMAVTHYFSRKLALFTRGRWPLGLYQGRYVTF